MRIVQRMLMCAALGLGGCQHPASVTCDDGGVCAAGSRCAMIGDTQVCVLPTCGNGRLDPGEACDDGNNVSGDGCPADCAAPCGDGTIDPDETCDDGNEIDGDGCDHNCTIAACGNGVVTSGESCDDGNEIDGDGCDSNCTPTGCGNGIVTAGETCDDGNTSNDDGCDRGCVPSCLLEKPAFTLTPSSALTLQPGRPATIDIAFINHNTTACAPVSFEVDTRFQVQGQVGAVQFEPSSHIAGIGVSSPLIPSGTTGHLIFTASVVAPVDPGTQFVVDFAIIGSSQGGFGGLEVDTVTITIGTGN